MVDNNFQFVIQAAEIKTPDGRFFTPKKDSSGYWTMPGFVFDAISRNGCKYDTAHMIDCTNNPSARFYRLLTEGSLHGEYGHPFTEDFGRLNKIMEANYGLHIKKIETAVIAGGLKVINVTFKEAGPFGQFVKEAMEDPDRNFSLSIRAACKEGPVQGGHQLLYPKTLVTFDGVGGGGYMEACKRFAMENYGYCEEHGSGDMVTSFNESDIVQVGSSGFFTEDIHNDQLLEYFRAESITVKTQVLPTREEITASIQQPSRATKFMRKYF